MKRSETCSADNHPGADRRTTPKGFSDAVPIGGFNEIPMIDLPDRQNEDPDTATSGGIQP
jgi:hypothetical protein